MRVEDAAVGAQHDELAGLIGRHQDRGAEVFEQGGKAGGVDTAQRRQLRLLRLGGRGLGGFVGLGLRIAHDGKALNKQVSASQERDTSFKPRVALGVPNLPRRGWTA